MWGSSLNEIYPNAYRLRRQGPPLSLKWNLSKLDFPLITREKDRN